MDLKALIKRTLEIQIEANLIPYCSPDNLDSMTIDPIADEAERKLSRLKSLGFDAAVGRNGELLHGIFLPHPNDLNPRNFCRISGQLTYGIGFGHVCKRLYGTANEPKAISNGLEEGSDVAGKLFFVLDDPSAPGCYPDRPGGILRDTSWGPERNKTADELLARYQKLDSTSTLNFALMNYYTLSLTWLSQVRTWKKAPPLPTKVDLISQPYNIVVDNGCPCGWISEESEPFFDARPPAADFWQNMFAAYVIVW